MTFPNNILRELFAAFVTFLTVTFLLTSSAAAESPGSVIVGDRVIFDLLAPVGNISPAERALIVNQRIEHILLDPKLSPEEIQVVSSYQGEQIISINSFLVLTVTEADAEIEGTTTEKLAKSWSRLFRDALIVTKPLYRPAKAGTPSFNPLLLITFLAFLVPLTILAFPKFPIPIVVGEIVIGILIGKSGFDLIRYDSSLQFLSEFGFTYLMFLAGLEVDVRILQSRSNKDSIRSAGPAPLTIACTIMLLTFVLALVVAYGLSITGATEQPLFMGLVLSTTSLGLVVPVLKDHKLIDTTYGQTLLMSAMLADFTTMFLITVVAGWLSSGPTMELLLGLILIIAFAFAAKLGHLIANHPNTNSLIDRLRTTSSHIAVRGSFALMLAFVALSETLGTEIILGAFLAGVLVSVFAPREDKDFRQRLEAIGYGFFIPIFFIMVGVRFDIGSLINSAEGRSLAALLIISGFCIKVIASLPFRSVYSWKETLAAGFLMSSRLTLVIAGAEIGIRLGIFPEILYSAVVALALVTCLVGPMIFSFLQPESSA